ncbi:MAG TPA: ATP-binding protein [Bacteroidota bacterium]|nr:ATP-binding protein [Bacteroidota bacterium]
MLVSITILTTVVSVYYFSQLSDSISKILIGNVQSMVAAGNMVREIERQESIQLRMLLQNDTLALASFDEHRKEFLRWYRIAIGSIALPTEPPILDSIMISYRNYLALSESLYTLLQEGTSASEVWAYQQTVIQPATERLKAKCFDLLGTNQDAILALDKRVGEISNQSMLIVITTSVLAVLLSVITAIQFSRSILTPAEKLTQTVRRIAQGHLNQKIDIATDDEIGELGREFNKMTERLRQYEEMNIAQIISEKKKSEAIVESIAEPIIVTNREHQLLLMNQAAAEMIGVRGADWQGKSVREVVQDEYWVEMIATDSMKQHQANAEEILLTLVKANKTYYFRPHQTTLTDEAGHIQAVVTLFQDVTRFKNLDQLKSDFIATVSHELRTPLTSLNMSLDIFSNEILGPINERQRDLLATAKDDAERLTKLVKELLELARLESGQYKIAKERINTHELVESGLKPVRLPLREKQIEVDIHIDPALPELYGDSQHLSWVLTNLISNALRYTDSGGKVTITVNQKNGEVLFMVSDTGRGIPKDALQTIFEKFIQIKQSSDSTPGSVGLGLAIAKQVVEAHGGRIWVESQERKGSTFYFSIPQAPTSP